MRKRYHPGLVLATYLVAVLLVAIPWTDTLARVLPARADEVAWRFGALGLSSRALMTPLLGLVLIAGTAVARGHRRVLRALAVVAGLAAATCTVAAGIFALDSLQMRGQVDPEIVQEFDISTVPALVKMVLVAVTLVPLSVGAWKSADAVGAGRRAGWGRDQRPPIAMRPER